MNFYLNNEHRKYMGINILKDSYDLVVIKKNPFEEIYLFFDGDCIKKIVEYFISDKFISMSESDTNYKTTDNRKIILPNRERGKPKKLNATSIKSLSVKGNYLYIYSDLESKVGSAIIGNYTTQRTYYEDEKIEGCVSLKDFEKWCDKFVRESTDSDLVEVEEFSKESIKHVKFREGDYFRVKLGRNLYTYGRILMDIYKRWKNGGKYWDILMGRPVMIEIFYILTDRKDMSYKELEPLPTFPAQHILNNNLYYGDYEIIVHGTVPKKTKYPIMYGKSISGINPNKIMLQCGEIYREIEYSKDKLIKKEENGEFVDFKNSAIGYSLNVDIETIKKCIKEKGEEPYWNCSYVRRGDLRSPQNRKYLKMILKQFELEELLDIYDD